MISEKWTLGQPVEEVQAAMQEEGCIQCLGCPHATVIASEIVHRTNSLLQFTDKTQIENSELHSRFEREIDTKREELSKLASNCSGYSDVKRESGRPAKMCDSPTSPDHKISVIAGRILEFLKF